MEERSLSLAAEVLLLSIDPADGGLLVRRRRLKKALAAAGGSYRAALAELRDAGVAGGGRSPVLIDRAPAGARFRRLQDAIREDDFADSDEFELFLLLAWTGVLARRLAADDRRRAARRLNPQRMTVSPIVAALVLTGSLTGSGLTDRSELVDASGLLDGVGTGADSGAGGADFSSWSP